MTSSALPQSGDHTDALCDAEGPASRASTEFALAAQRKALVEPARKAAPKTALVSVDYNVLESAFLIMSACVLMAGMVFERCGVVAIVLLLQLVLFCCRVSSFGRVCVARP